jgi:uncharacterized protein (TIGR03067 family)
MRLISFLLAGFLVLSCVAYAGQADDANKLQGAWSLTDLVVGGAKVPEKDIQGVKFVFDKDTLTILSPPADADPKKDVVIDKRVFKFKLDPTKKPAQIDVTALDGQHKGVTSPGIYELKDDTLRWCQSDDEKSKDRPKDFSSPEKSSIYVFTLKRAKVEPPKD